jgi:serine/threonine-protein kinase
MEGQSKKETPRLHRALPSRREGSGPGATLSTHLLLQAARRLRVITLLYAVVFFFADIFTQILYSGFSFHDPRDWMPSSLSIVAALAVALLTTRRDIHPAKLMAVGLAFEVVGSFGIATAQYWGVYHRLDYRPEHLNVFGLSWVAVWIMIFTIAIPARPKHALLAALASGSAVPIMMALTMKYGGTSIVLTPLSFFIGLVFPYILVVLMAYVGSHVIYRLGLEERRARDLGSYRLVELIGRGGMGEVWRAEHSMLARPAAVKLVRPESVGDMQAEGASAALRRLEREAQATASMHSPNTIQVYDCGISEEGMFYYVMELLDGFDLQSLVERFGPVAPERAIHFLRQACHSLAEAHGQSLIHRDIKPANLISCRYGRDVDFIKVLDFGLVKRHGHTDQTQASITAQNVLGGTPAYMAPEQIVGNRPVDGRTDLYALGCVGYWLLTGLKVFDGNTPMGTMVMHVQQAPIPPSRRTENTIPASIERVILECLEKDPDRRPQTADELSARLLACDSATAWTPERARRWWETHRPTSVAGQPEGEKKEELRHAPHP